LPVGCVRRDPARVELAGADRHAATRRQAD
jgi:hypothetical protein